MKIHIFVLFLLLTGTLMITGCNSPPPAPPEPEFIANPLAQNVLSNVTTTTTNGTAAMIFDQDARLTAVIIQSPVPELQTLQFQNGEANLSFTLPAEVPIAGGQTFAITFVTVSTILEPSGDFNVDCRGELEEIPEVEHLTLRFAGTIDMTNPQVLIAGPTVTLIATVNVLLVPVDFVVFSVSTE